MNKTHLIYIIPITLMFGAFIGINLFTRLTDSLFNGLNTESMRMLEDCQIAYTEVPLSDYRVRIDKEFCYIVNNVSVCPKRILQSDELIESIRG